MHNRVKYVTKICKYCLIPFTTPNSGRPRKACPDPQCQNKRRIDYARSQGHAVMEPRPCKYCGNIFMPKTKNANRRRTCYNPDCIAKNLSMHHRISADFSKLSDRVCTLCGHRLPHGRHYYHEQCLSIQVYRTDGEYKYAPHVDW